jgi:hypothetical protein
MSMPGSSLLVAVNALLLRWLRLPASAESTPPPNLEERVHTQAA